MTCGQGRTTRQVMCVDYSDRVMDQSQCDTDYIPEAAQDCSLPPCPRQTPDRGLAQHPFQNVGYHPRSLGPSQTHVLGGNQWRTGPWGAVSITASFPNLPLLSLEAVLGCSGARTRNTLGAFFSQGLKCTWACFGGEPQWVHRSP